MTIFFSLILVIVVNFVTDFSFFVISAMYYEVKRFHKLYNNFSHISSVVFYILWTYSIRFLVIVNLSCNMVFEDSSGFLSKGCFRRVSLYFIVIILVSCIIAILLTSIIFCLNSIIYESSLYDKNLNRYKRNDFAFRNDNLMDVPFSSKSAKKHHKTDSTKNNINASHSDSIVFAILQAKSLRDANEELYTRYDYLTSFDPRKFSLEVHLTDSVVIEREVERYINNLFYSIFRSLYRLMIYYSTCSKLYRIIVMLF